MPIAKIAKDDRERPIDIKINTKGENNSEKKNIQYSFCPGAGAELQPGNGGACGGSDHLQRVSIHTSDGYECSVVVNRAKSHRKLLGAA